MHAFLICQGNKIKRVNKGKEIIKRQKIKIKRWPFHPDLLYFANLNSILISHIRQIQQFLSYKPFQLTKKIVFIAEAEKITLVAQNAFLKTLEEPPPNSLIILCAPQKEDLIDTITSRCQIINLEVSSNIKLNKKNKAVYLSLIKNILKANMGERLILIEPYEKNREDAIKFCQQMIILLRKLIFKKIKYSQFSPYLLQQLLQKFLQAEKFLQANVNVRLVLDNLVLSL